MGRRTWKDTVPVVVRSSQLKQRSKLTPLLSRKWDRSRGAFDLILIQVDEDEIILGQLNLFVTTLNADNIGTRRFECLNQSRRKDRNENTRPNDWVK